MTIEEAITKAHKMSGTTGIFYNPANLDAVFARHGQEPAGYFIWCDCSKAVRFLEMHGGDVEFTVRDMWEMR